MDITTPHYDITIDTSSPSSLVSGCLSVIVKVRPSWDVAKVNLNTFTDGLTNKLVGATCREEEDKEDGEDWEDKEDREDMVLVKVYGEDTDKYIDRKREVMIMKRMFGAGCGSQLYATFLNGIAYKFLPGKILEPQMLTQPEVYRKVAGAVARMHSIELGNHERKAIVWQDLQKLLDLYPTSFKDTIKQEKFLSSIPTKEEMKREVSSVQLSLKQAKRPLALVLCHNDLLPANMVLTGDTVTLIDLEYGGPNYQALDIAILFNLSVGAHGQLDYDRDYPQEQRIKDWIKEYLNHFNGETPTQMAVEELYGEVILLSPCGHLFWSIWSVVQAAISSIDFDFLDYAKQMMDQYNKLTKNINVGTPETM